MLTSLSLSYLGSEETNATIFDSEEQANPASEAGLLEEVDDTATPSGSDDGASADALEEIPLPDDADDTAESQ